MPRVLVRLPNWLGDALMARPFLRALRAAMPNATIAALGPPAFLELLASDRAWDEAVGWPTPRGAAPGARPERAEWAFVLPPSFSSAWRAFRGGAARRVGFAHEGRSPLLTHALRRPPRGDLHLSREYLALGEVAGIAPLTDAGALAVADEWRADAARLLAGTGPYAVLAPGATYGPAKRWSAERFAQTGRRLAGQGLRVLLCGGEGERGTCDDVAARCGAESFAGRTSLTAMAALCSGAEAVVSNDSGMAHLAGAVGAPTVVVFGSTSSAWTAPLGERVVVVQRPPVCSPCFARTCAIGYRCLEAVSVDDVLAAVERARACVPAPASASAGGGA